MLLHAVLEIIKFPSFFTNLFLPSFCFCLPKEEIKRRQTPLRGLKKQTRKKKKRKPSFCQSFFKKTLFFLRNNYYYCSFGDFLFVLFPFFLVFFFYFLPLEEKNQRKKLKEGKSLFFCFPSSLFERRKRSCFFLCFCHRQTKKSTKGGMNGVQVTGTLFRLVFCFPSFLQRRTKP